tara:strand:+ start:616 stop:810 length:195 start_codon:yes stop_codon:yes gene_type:complete
MEKPDDSFFFDLGVNLYQLVEKELRMHGISADVTSGTDAAIDAIVRNLDISLSDPDEQELDSPR